MSVVLVVRYPSNYASGGPDGNQEAQRHAQGTQAPCRPRRRGHLPARALGGGPPAPGTRSGGGEGMTARIRSSATLPTLILACVAQFMVILDVSVVNVALPSIRHGLHFSATSLQW